MAEAKGAFSTSGGIALSTRMVSSTHSILCGNLRNKAKLSQTQSFKHPDI